MLLSKYERKLKQTSGIKRLNGFSFLELSKSLKKSENKLTELNDERSLIVEKTAATECAMSKILSLGVFDLHQEYINKLLKLESLELELRAAYEALSSEINQIENELACIAAKDKKLGEKETNIRYRISSIYDESRCQELMLLRSNRELS